MLIVAVTRIEFAIRSEIEKVRSIAQVSYNKQCKVNAIFHFKVVKFQEPNICAC